MTGRTVRASAAPALERLFARVVEVAAGGVALTTLDPLGSGLRIIYANAALGALIGAEPEQLVSAGLEVVLGPRTDLDEIRARLGHGQAADGRTRHDRHDGTSLELGWRLEPLPGDDEIAHHVLTVRRLDDDGSPDGSADEWRTAQDLLARAEQRTRELVEQVPAIFYEEVPATDGETYYVSPQIEEILGVSPADYRRQQDWWERHLHPEDPVKM